MEKSAFWLKLWTFGLTLIVLAATYLIIVVNPIEIAALYLGALAIVTGIGLATNLWGGSIASVLAVFAIVLMNQFSGIYPRESLFINVATELIALLLAGPLAGQTGALINRMYRRGVYWRARAHQQAVHDETLGILKPEFAKIRLDEEILRATTFNRSLAVLSLDIVPHRAPDDPGEHQPVLQALARLARAFTAPPSVVTRTAENQLTLILPEYTAAQAAELAQKLTAQAEKTPFFAATNAAALGASLSQWGNMRAGIAALNGQPETGENLLARAQNALNGVAADV